ncbi:polysaccharide biosynthesis C-terminal domain-containing protein [Zobellia galactanivorans]|uniref:lipopolysaccharide biosynthesis protein n=1 Tax=Zobellia TaxID=112040 RepID=UPI000B5385EB|nr:MULTISPECIES: polysaccharide biosynthesis C-terminal domain-containing protein [Zobellia]MBU3024617.1 polysaccharide biosynthesis C-terminal domain-containing protein [Zobellia galactanivorans]MDO6807774.1 polysaccharide biosynthesis C-terminal domain-containing protein [Zobellia galactanivorans]OWW25578.1 sugar isomerase [Zobellia sp. OII3]
MGIVFKQSLNNSIITYLGFGLGALNTLVLYLQFMDPEYYGLLQVVLSASVVLMPLLAFGVPNTLVKFYSGFNDSKSTDGFLTLMLFLPLALMLPIAGITYVVNDAIGSFLSKENPIVKDYVWHIFLIAMVMAYFEVFYAWARVHMKSVFGNFMKEIFGRVGQTTLLVLLYFKVISVTSFIDGLVIVYILRMLVMKLYAYRLHRPRLVFDFPENTPKILVYSALIILGGSVAIVLLEIDKVMINQFIKIENVAYYSVASFIALVIAVPSRSMHQITYPLTAELLNRKDAVGLKRLYQKSSLTLYVISGLLFVLIFLNLDDLYKLLPDAYRHGYFIFVWLGLAKLYDALLGNNNSILYNSDYYRAVLFMGVFLAIVTVLLNVWLIPAYGLDGAAIASFLAFFIYNTVKLVYVKMKFDILPFTKETIAVTLLMIGTVLVFYFVTLPFHPILNIMIKGLGISLLYVGVVYKFKISEDVYQVLNGLFGKKGE